MASVLDFITGARFRLRVRSSLTANPRVRWFNTYEFRSTNSGGVEMLSMLAGNVGTFHVLTAYNYVTVDEVLVSTWEPDSHPYNPLGFFTLPMATVGSIPLGVKTPVALRQTLFVERVTQSGLQGKLFLRGALSNEDIVANDGEWVLVDPSGIGTDLAAAIVSSGMEFYLDGIDSASFYLCLIGNDGETRPVTGLGVNGTSDVKLNHKYFDRTPGP